MEVTAPERPFRFAASTLGVRIFCWGALVSGCLTSPFSRRTEEAKMRAYAIVPFVLGTSPARRSSGASAARMARARLLKTASAL